MHKLLSRSTCSLSKRWLIPLVKISTAKTSIPTSTTAKPSSLVEDFHRNVDRDTTDKQIAIIQDDIEISYNELNFVVNNLCLKLVNEYKLSKGDTIVHLSATRIDAVQIQLACAKLGIIHVPMYSLSTKHQFETTMNLLKPSLIISDCKYPNVEAFVTNNSEYQDKTVYLSDKFDANNWFAKEFTSENDQLGLGTAGIDINLNGEAVTNDDILTILFTSGTTGDPKGCAFTHAAMHYNAVGFESISAADSRRQLIDMYLCLVPQHGIGGAAQRISCVCRGLTALFPNKEKFRDTFHWLDLINKYPNNNILTLFFGKALSDLYSYSKENINNNKDFSQLVELRYAGDFVPLNIVDHLKSHLFKHTTFLTGYGMTEGGCMSLLDPLANYSNDPNAVPIGKMILNDEGDVVGADPNYFVCNVRLEKDGEILVDTQTSNGSMKEYYKDKNKTDELIDSDGWLHTGDIGEIEKQTGFVYFKSRKKDVIVLEEDTRMIMPGDIESVIAKHEYVNECAVVGYPNRLLRNDDISLGESPCAFIVVDKSISNKEQNFDSIIQQIELLCQENLPPIMQLKKYVFVETLPKTPTNKVDKKVLRQRIANQEFQDIQNVK